MTQKILKEARRQQAQLEDDIEERGDDGPSGKAIKGKLTLGKASSEGLSEDDDDDFEFNDQAKDEEEYEDVVRTVLKLVSYRFDLS